MTKVSTTELLAALSKILDGAKAKPRKFVETVELQISLKDYDTRVDKRFSGTVLLPNIPRPRKNVCVLGDAAHCEQARRASIPYRSVDDLRALNRNKKLVKRFLAQFHAFLASQAVIRQIPRLLGPTSGKAAKFPRMLRDNEDLESKVAEILSEVKFQLKKVTNLAVPVGNVGMTLDELKDNCTLAINFQVSLLKGQWKNVSRLYVKSTMGKPEMLYKG
eukprot:TRINITY_DN28620_c0_g1_i1.p1 TRINITY_DN28620_c0_g1~~TRINITY_DN28620_c0_g1_i1.p1  ORF type:complete len:219 (+),score=39.90 TRINITY_DN28620_c0_g1_i1:70-726(+)